MLHYEALAAQPLFYLFIALTLALALGYFVGRRRNQRLSRAAFDELTATLRPADQTYTNIGGAIGYHAEYVLPKKSVLAKVEATLTLLPRHALLYLPVSLLLRRWDRLYLFFLLRQTPPAEGHLIEARYHRFAPRITNEERMQQDRVQWGGRPYLLLATTRTTRDHLRRLIEAIPDPDGLKHVAIVPHQKRCFVFMVPRVRAVQASLEPLYRWLETVV